MSESKHLSVAEEGRSWDDGVEELDVTDSKAESTEVSSPGTRFVEVPIAKSSKKRKEISIVPCSSDGVVMSKHSGPAVAMKPVEAKKKSDRTQKVAGCWEIHFGRRKLPLEQGRT
ncbi:hypothetical protein C2S51_023117 [Perilla frutescens var. frutescens]|nr:hypothetical protein C2S51_023117 [Perilla frutescens var. frutescens]